MKDTLKDLGQLVFRSFVYGSAAMTGMIVANEIYVKVRDKRVKKAFNKIINDAEKALENLKENEKKNKKNKKNR